jgi:hypothetical protein
VKDIVLRVGSATENVVPRRRAEIEELAAMLSKEHRSIAIEERERIPERYGIIWAETVGIFVGAAASTTIIGAIVTDVYNTAKKWARNQFKKKSEASLSGRVRTQSFTIYGPDGKPLLYWKISSEGEEEVDYRKIQTSVGDDNSELPEK